MTEAFVLARAATFPTTRNGLRGVLAASNEVRTKASLHIEVVSLEGAPEAAIATVVTTLR